MNLADEILRRECPEVDENFDAGYHRGFRAGYEEARREFAEMVREAEGFRGASLTLTPESVEQLEKILNEPSTCKLVPRDIPLAIFADRVSESLAQPGEPERTE